MKIRQEDIDYLVIQFKVKQQKNSNEVQELTVRQARELLKTEGLREPKLKAYEQLVVVGSKLFRSYTGQGTEGQPLCRFQKRKTFLKLVNMVD